jgi:hypothetical protein
MIEGNNTSCIAFHTGDEIRHDFLQRARRISAAAPDLTGLRDVERLFRTGH